MVTEDVLLGNSECRRLSQSSMDVLLRGLCFYDRSGVDRCFTSGMRRFDRSNADRYLLREGVGLTEE
jgi:hypothetical protein